MVGLAGPRVLVLDDEWSEAAPVIRSLSSQGIPSTYFNGEEDQLPKAPFENIRLALLDVELYAGASRATTVATLVNVLRNLVDSATAGLVLVLWTKHPDYAQEVWARLLSEGGPVPIHMATVSKEDFKVVGSDDFNFSKLDAHLRGQLADVGPWPTILEWEQQACEAAAGVVSELSRLAHTDLPLPATAADLPEWQGKIRKRLSTMLTTLASSELGAENVEDGEDVLRGAYGALSPLLADHVEERTLNLARREKVTGEEIRTESDPAKLPATLDARLHTRWHISGECSRTWTGNIYPVDGVLAAEVARVYPDFKKVLIEHLAEIKPTTSEANAKQKREKLESNILDMVLIDIHPVCDHAQKKALGGRFLAGVRMAVGSKVPTNIDSLWHFGPLWDDDAQKAYTLAIDLKRPLVCSLGMLKAATPWRRLRQSVMVELLARVAGHSQRPGTLRFGK